MGLSGVIEVLKQSTQPLPDNLQKPLTSFIIQKCADNCGSVATLAVKSLHPIITRLSIDHLLEILLYLVDLMRDPDSTVLSSYKINDDGSKKGMIKLIATGPIMLFEYSFPRTD